MGGGRLVYLGQPLNMVNQQLLHALVGISFRGTVRRKCGADRKGADHAQAVEDYFADTSGSLCRALRKIQADDFLPIPSLQNQERSRIKSLMVSTRNFFPSSDNAEKLWSESSKE